MRTAAFAMLITLGATAALTAAPISITPGSGLTYTQSFDTLPNSGGPFTWTDDSTLSGWYANRAVSGSTSGTPALDVTDGSVNLLAGLKSAGSASATDRALGAIADNNPTEFAYGARFVNNVGVAVTSFTLTYDGEQWADRSTTADTLRFYYRIGGISFNLADSTGRTGWTAVTALNFVSPQNASAGALNGNLAANRIDNISTTINLSLISGDTLWIGWFEENDDGTDHLLGVDDLIVNFVPVPEPGTVALLALGAALVSYRTRRRRA